MGSSTFISSKNSISALLLLVSIIIANCSPPEDPIKCSSKNTDCTITNSYHMFPDRSTCRASNVAYPTTEQELIETVKTATMSKRKMKVATRFSHSITKLVCVDGQDGLLISTKFLNRTVNIDRESMTVTVESGVTLRQLINVAAKEGLALPNAPYWWGLTIGGMLGTGAHGSSLWGRGSSVHDYLSEIRIVSPGDMDDGFVKVRTVNENDKDFDAVKVSLGVLGVISQVTFRLEPMFKRSITFVKKNDSDLADQAATFGLKHEFADILWYPSLGDAVYRLDDRVPVDTKGDGLYEFFPFRSTLSLILASRRSTEEFQETVRDDSGKCGTATLTTGILSAIAYGLTNDGSFFKGYPVIGTQNRLQSSGTCLDSANDGLITACGWDSRVKGEFFHQTTFKVKLSLVKDFIQDVQKLVALKPKSLCGIDLYNGILMRYVKASNAYLANQEDSIDFDFTYYRSKDPLSPRLYEDIIEEIEQMAILKYNALPHWGKNRNLAFDGVIKKYINAPEFLKVKDVYDSLGLFSSEWTDQVLGLKNGVTIVKKGCALEGLCICSQDVHCAPAKGYFCRPGKVYKDARVCTRDISTLKNRLVSMVFGNDRDEL